MVTALGSLLLNRPVRADVAMTGEITLRGLVLPVGGIKDKVLAAAAAGIKTVILPARNRRNFEEVPAEAHQGMHFVFVKTVDDVMSVALAKPPRRAASRPARSKRTARKR